MRQRTILAIWQVSARRIQGVEQDRAPSRLVQAIHSLNQPRAIVGRVLPNLDVPPKAITKARSVCGRKTRSRKSSAAAFSSASTLLDRIAGVQNDAQPQRQVLVTRKVVGAGDGRLIVEDANVIRREVLHEAAALVGHGELKPDFGHGAADRISGRGGERRRLLQPSRTYGEGGRGPARLRPPAYSPGEQTNLPNPKRPELSDPPVRRSPIPARVAALKANSHAVDKRRLLHSWVIGDAGREA